MPPPTRPHRRWVFTLNNPTVEEVDEVREAFQAPFITYGVFGREVGANGTPHLQGFFILSRSQRLSYVRRRVNARAHYECAVGTSFQAASYCKKDGDYEEVGEPPVDAGRRSDIDAFVEWGEQFISENGRAPTSPEVAVERPREYLRFPRAVALFQRRAPPPSLRVGNPRQWQIDLEMLLEVEADDRTVRFYVDSDGGKGKTWFQQYYVTKFPRRAQVLGIGKRDDLAYSLDVSKSVFFFNVARDGMQYLQYTILEQLKDRMVYSSKYHSVMKTFHHNNHVIVFCNEAPDMTKMSADRYQITLLV